MNASSSKQIAQVLMNSLVETSFNQHVVITLPSDKSKIVELRPNSSISLGKFGAFYVNDVVGFPFGTKFEIYYDEETKSKNESVPETPKEKNRTPIGKIRVIEHFTANVDENDEFESREASVSLENLKSSETNKDLINIGNDIQKLSTHEIEELKKQSSSTSEIISKIIESHGSFDKKTVHSQKKYLNRKRQKFAKEFTIEYLSSSALLHYLIEKGDIQRVMDMSEESIGMLLNLANIRSNGTYLCMDETGGLLVYFLLERMFGGHENWDENNGKIIVIHENEHPNLDLLKFSNYAEKFITQHVITISLIDFFEPPTMDEINDRFTPLSKEEVYELKSNKKNTYYRKLKWYSTQLEILRYVKEVEYDALVVATTLYLPSLIPKLSQRVHGSRPIVCYSQFKEILLELSHTLYDDLNFLAPTILETRCRPFQTIRGKLHPKMTMRGGGGYLMWCHKVIPVNPDDIPDNIAPKSTDKVEKPDLVKS